MAKNLILTRARFCLLSVFEKEIKFHFVTLAKKKTFGYLIFFMLPSKEASTFLNSMMLRPQVKINFFFLSFFYRK